jgi:hypothetical protein
MIEEWAVARSDFAGAGQEDLRAGEIDTLAHGGDRAAEAADVVTVKMARVTCH